MQIPNTVPDLIQMLDEKYPNRTIRIGETELQAHRYAGSREVIDFLITALKQSERKALGAEQGIL